MPLEKALNVVSAIKVKNGGNPLDPKLVADYCGLSATNNDFVYLFVSAGDVAVRPDDWDDQNPKELLLRSSVDNSPTLALKSKNYSSVSRRF